MVDVLVCKLVALARYRGAQKHTIKPTFYLSVFARFRSTVQEKFDQAVTSSPKPISFDYTLHNTVLENVPHTKYLGVTIQSNLKWDVHCKQVAAKATNTLNVLKRNLKSTKEVCERAYKSLVRPQVEYAASVWSPWLARDKARIERVQRRAARYVYNTYSRYSSVTAMLQSLDWETLESRRFKCIKFIVRFCSPTSNIFLFTFCSLCKEKK